MLGIGIDTGGTCTDAVICDLETNAVLASGKAQTTHDDLKIGIRKALEQLPQELLHKSGTIALSTTIATNACVEDKGGRGKLILIGPDRKVFEKTHASYGIRSSRDVLLVDCRIVSSREKSEKPDWDRFREEIREFLKDCDCAAVVQMYAADHNGAYEKKAAEIIREEFELPVILGHDLFPDRNLYRRGAGALLNARLVPEVRRFMEAIRLTFEEMGLQLPTTIIKSDGSQMSREYALLRPVETLLSGPAASVTGAGILAEEEQALVVDIGGTTTDVALIRNGVPDYSGDGIRIGAWKTFVKGLYVDTFGLGGDTAVHYSSAGRLYLENYRVIPLCDLAARYPSVLEKLRKLDAEERNHPYPIHEFLVVQKDIAGSREYSDEEKALCCALAKQPLSLEDAARAAGSDVYSLTTAHLEENGVILRAGLTPTDIMHIRGDFEGYCKEASLYAAHFVVRSSEAKNVEDLCRTVYDLVTERLYKNLIRILLTTECRGIDEPDDRQIRALIDHSWKTELEREHRQELSGRAAETQKNSVSEQGLPAAVFCEKERMLPVLFQTPAKIIAVGAPSHVFLPRVAAMLHTEAVLPPYADVANAVGAVTGGFSAVTEVTVTPVRQGDREVLEVLTAEQKTRFEDREEAFAFARRAGTSEAEAKAREQGAAGEVQVTVEQIHKEGVHRYGTTWLMDVLRFRASSAG
ncbi:MAG: hydantoinase/oxoprolinase family protein [Eubacterium sp.]|nr:hydantoinase/oxoprolinase family protein [Eubacterium sp.]